MFSQRYSATARYVSWEVGGRGSRLVVWIEVDLTPPGSFLRPRLFYATVFSTAEFFLTGVFYE